MGETYEFPDAEDVPKITVSSDEPYTKPEQKHLFITYDDDEWESERQMENVAKTINALFGTNVQIAIMPKGYDLISEGDLRNMLDDVED